MEDDGDSVMTVAAVEGCIEQANENVVKLKPKTKAQKQARSQALEDINYVQRVAVYNLRKAFEGNENGN
jgi:ERCC4-type nuclease